MTWSRVRAALPVAQLSLICWLLSGFLLAGWSGVDAAAVMSVDLGSECMKVAVVTPGVPMEIVLNRESKRKTPAVIAYRDAIRSFGEDAQTAGIRDPASAYGYLLDLLGKTIDNPIVELYRLTIFHCDCMPHSSSLKLSFYSFVGSAFHITTSEAIHCVAH